MRISVAVITYNWPQALELVLRALAVQTELPYEVIVTDDGSRPATRELLAAPGAATTRRGWCICGSPTMARG